MVEAVIESEIAAEAPAVLAPAPRPYRRYALGLLLGIYVLNCLDRQVINILAEPIKREFRLADWQVGLMSGVSFALIYSLTAFPIARMAEHRHRPRIIAAALACWCGFTALCGAAQSYVQLCLFRFGVGVGEAGCTPPALSLISDYFPKDKRASALGIYAVGAPLGVLTGLGFGGLVADAYGWRTAFLLAGAPGVVLAAVVFATLREPRARLAAVRAAQPGIGGTLRVLLSKPTFWLLAFAAGFKMVFTDGQAPFLASFFLRSHPAEVAALAARFHLGPMGFLGLTLGGINGVFGVLSGWVGGAIADRAAARDVRNIVIAPAIALLVAAPAYIAALCVGDATLALAFLVIQCSTNVFWAGPVYATIHGVTPVRMRATATAMALFIINIMGTGLGPLLIGAMSDAFGRTAGLGPAAGLRAALITASLISLVGVALYWRARRTIVADLEPEAA